MEAAKIQLTKENETYLATLYGKALDAAVAQPILNDRWAADAVARIDYDFTKLKLPKGAEVTLALRAWHFDQWTRAFLAANPVCTVLHMGCGLDTRVDRIDPGPAVRWFDVDLPDVIALRQQLYPERAGYRQIGASVTDLAWLSAIPADAPVLVVAEGLMMYIAERDVMALFRRITEQFPSGQIAFDGYNGAMVRLVSRFVRVSDTRIKLVWGVDDPRDLERQIARLRLVQSVSFLTMPELTSRIATTGPSRAAYGIVSRLPFYRKLVRHLLYAFSGGPAV